MGNKEYSRTVSSPSTTRGFEPYFPHLRITTPDRTGKHPQRVRTLQNRGVGRMARVERGPDHSGLLPLLKLRPANSVVITFGRNGTTHRPTGPRSPIRDHETRSTQHFSMSQFTPCVTPPQNGLLRAQEHNYLFNIYTRPSTYNSKYL